MPIHPSAVVDPQARIDPSATVGPYVVIEGPVCVGPEAVIEAHACLAGNTTIAARCHVFPHAVIGQPPQDLGYDGSPTECRIGEATIIREGVTVHRATGAGTRTVVGAGCLLMANSHVAHNCVVADNVVMANGVLLGGHVHVGPRAFLGGASVVHQFVRIGELAMLAGLARVTTDVPPFMLAEGDNRCIGINVVGMRRAGFDAAERQEIRELHRTLYRRGLCLGSAMEVMIGRARTAPGSRFLQFLREPSRRGIISGRRPREADD